MVKDFLPVDITEPALNVALAQLLRRRELQALGEVVVHREAKGVGKKPDVLLTVNGVKVIIEGKFAVPGIESVLEKQCIDRIEDGLCEICIGIIYSKMPTTSLTLTTKEVDAKLLKSKFQALVTYVAPPEMEQLSFDFILSGVPPGLKKMGWYEVDINELASLVRSSYTSVVSEDILGKAVESFASALQGAVEKLIASNPPDVLAAQISKIMEIPKAPHEEPEED
ncbi:MAG: hypothetical protein E3J66_02685 [Dehalococcoidia bacterium]|nr:MAG: hypothetical protein E3J66_02685 [Dehalococcoidia bacterium]